ncbi:hypothetical protein CGCSCA4_v014020 [Colletotrichum siamense]|uniref:Uncharacterized protein n=1 Tax=Colletotrichum siamense TaxID=690259 RepID=A0A9P5BMH0_COLSI|nr:hypothetical protein CGCSCA4_v014020 [Colletotrichum siamense]KAF4843835.1 hypothetical protein CGCSCA2_v014083 [Colletotrichum siamense]
MSPLSIRLLSGLVQRSFKVESVTHRVSRGFTHSISAPGIRILITVAMNWMTPHEASLQKLPAEADAEPETSVLDRKRPVPRFPDSFSANLGRKVSSPSSPQEISASATHRPPPSPLPESQSVINRKRDVIAGIAPPLPTTPLPTSRNRQVSTASSVKAMVARFEGGGCDDAPDKSDNMADSINDAPFSPIDSIKTKAPVDDSINTVSSTLAPSSTSHAGVPKTQTIDEGELELLKMQEFYKTEPLARCLDNYVPPKRNKEKVKVLPIKQDEGASMLKAAKLELHNTLAKSHEAYEERHPSAKEERLQREAAEAFKKGEPSKNNVSSSTPSEASTKSSRRTKKKALQKAQKKAEKAAKREGIDPIDQKPSSSTTTQPSQKEWTLRGQYPETFAKIDYWRSLPDPDAPQSSSATQTPGLVNQSFSSKDRAPRYGTVSHATSHDDSLASSASSSATLVPSQNQSISVTTADNHSSDGDSTDYDQDNTSRTINESDEAAIPSSQGANKPMSQHLTQKGGVRNYLHISDDELSDGETAKVIKAAAKQKEKRDADRRAHEAVNAAHAAGRIVHLENTKSIRDQISTNVKKSDIKPGFGKKAQPVPAFDEMAYSADSIACHTLKPAPLRIPSRTKQPSVEGSEKKERDTPRTPAPQLSGELKVNKGKHRVENVLSEAPGIDVSETGIPNNRNQIASSTRQKTGSINFSRPHTKNTQNQKQSDAPSNKSSSPAGGKKSKASARDKRGKKSASSASEKETQPGGGGYQVPSRDELNSFFGTKNQPGPVDAWLKEAAYRQKRREVEAAVAAAKAAQAAKASQASQPAQVSRPTTQTSHAAQNSGRQSFTAGDYQDLIQDDYNDLIRESPEKKQATHTQGGSSRVVPQTIDFNGQYPQTQQLAGARHHGGGPALPPTPASAYRPRVAAAKTTDEMMGELDDFFAEENDHLYEKKPGRASNSTAGGSQQQEPWDDPAYNEEALQYGYAYMQNNHTPLPDNFEPVPLTREQRRQVLAANSIAEADYPAPPAGYPTPAGPADGENTPPCPTRPPPSVPAPGTGTGTGGGNGQGRQRGSGEQVQSLRRAPRRFQRAATAPTSAPKSPAPGYDDDWF